MGSLPELFPEAFIRVAKTSASDRGMTFIDEDGVSEKFFSFAEVASRASRIGAALQRMGLKKGDRLVFVLTNDERFVFSFLGAVLVGVAPVPMYPPKDLDSANAFLVQCGHIVRTSQPAGILCDPLLKDLLEQFHSGPVHTICTLDDLEKSNDEYSPVSFSGDDLAFVQFTSGSTSQPKGVIVRHKNLAINAHYINLGLNVTADDRGASWLPFYHDMGLIGFVLAPLTRGTPGVFSQPLAFIKRPVEWLRMISRHRATITYAPNFAYDLCVRRIRMEELEGLDLSSVRIAGCGAEPIQLSKLQAFAKKFSAIGFDERALLLSFGMAEATLAVAFTPIGQRPRGLTLNLQRMVDDNLAVPVEDDHKGAVTVADCGRPFTGHELAILDENGNRCPDRVVGEIIVSGPSVADGYFNDPAATQETFRDGWLYTGDLGFLDNGHLYVCGRRKDIIIVAGKNYYPSDVEWLASSVNGVRQGKVVAFCVDSADSRDRAHEKVVVCAETRTDPQSLAELRRQIPAVVVDQLGIKIHEVLLLPPGSLPKTSSGKVQRRRTRQLYLEGKLVRRDNTGVSLGPTLELGS